MAEGTANPPWLSPPSTEDLGLSEVFGVSWVRPIRRKEPLLDMKLIYTLAAALIAVLLFGLISWVLQELLGWDYELIWGLFVALVAILGGNAAVRKLGN